MIINYSDQEVIKGEKSIFLAGPTPRGENIISWRTDACEILKQFDFDGVVYVPEYSTWKPKEDYVDQAMWERIALINATVILFWIPRKLPDMAAFTTNVEFGYWLHSGKVIYGRPNDASKIKYLDWLYRLDYDKNPYETLQSLLEASVELTNNLYNEQVSEILPLEERKIIKKLRK
ncbi:MAG: nucleoside 2-deoxyribosyltransferase domain-containing protein [Bacilli bacterium]|nr:nucleoside 2-deoxyribosyltransferase domain-containing protein [Bacilli bacterium]